MYPRFGQKSIYDKLNINAQNNQNTFQRKNQANITNNNNIVELGQIENRISYFK